MARPRGVLAEVNGRPAENEGAGTCVQNLDGFPLLRHSVNHRLKRGRLLTVPATVTRR